LKKSINMQRIKPYRPSKLPLIFTDRLGKRWILTPELFLIDPGAWYPLPTELPGNTILSSRWNNILSAIQDTSDGHRHDGTDSLHLPSGQWALADLPRGTAGMFFRGAGAGSSSVLEAIPFPVIGVLLNPSAAINIPAVLAFPFACTVTGLKGWRVGGTGATVNAGKGTTASPTNPVLASDLSLTSTETAMDGGAVQNTAFAVGDPLILILSSVSGSPTEVAIQVSFTRP
jgi:hypothetical protein